MTKKKMVTKKLVAKKSIIKKPIVKKKTTKTPNIVSNRIKTPDGTILISRHVHDYVDYTDKVTGKYYSVDGGHEYLKRGFEGHYEELSVFDNDNFDLIRNTMEWGTYGIDGKQPLQYRTLKCMTNNHIKMVLKTQTHISKWAKKILEKEIKYRIKKKINIKDPIPAV